MQNLEIITNLEEVCKIDTKLLSAIFHVVEIDNMINPETGNLKCTFKSISHSNVHHRDTEFYNNWPKVNPTVQMSNS
jgi:hypothetical protein